MVAVSIFDKLKKKLTMPKVKSALNEGKFKEFVDDIRDFKKKEKIEGTLIDIAKEQKTGDLPSLAKKFDVIIPPSGILDVPEIERTLSALRSLKKITKGLKEDVVFPRYVDIYPPAGESKGKVRGMGKPKESKERLDANEEQKTSETQKEIMKGVERTKVKLADDVQEEGEPKQSKKEMKKIIDSIVDTALATAVKNIESRQKEKLTKDQREVIREQLEAEAQGKIKKSSVQAKPKESRERASIKKTADEILKGFEKIKETSEKQKKKQEEEEEEKEEERPAEPMTDRTKVPSYTAEDIENERKAQADARASRATSGMTDEQEAELFDIPQPPSENVKMDMKKPDMRSEIDDLQPLPSKTDFIPPMRLGTRGKDIKELLDDISYFMKNFKGQLKREAEIFKEVDKTNIEQLRKLHNRIVGKLAPSQKKEGEKKVGIIVNADEYIREQMKKILQEQTFSNLRPQDVVIDVGSKTAEGRDTKDFGDFAVKRTIDGGLASTREAVFRYMPSENDDQVGEEGQTEKQRKKPNRIALPKSRLNNQRTTAIRMNVQNPFRVPQKTMKLKYLY